MFRNYNITEQFHIFIFDENQILSHTYEENFKGFLENLKMSEYFWKWYMLDIFISKIIDYIHNISQTSNCPVQISNKSVNYSNLN